MFNCLKFEKNQIFIDGKLNYYLIDVDLDKCFGMIVH